MKRLFVLLLMLSMMLVGCQNSDYTDSTLSQDVSLDDMGENEPVSQNIPYRYTRKYDLYKATEDYGFTLIEGSGVEKNEGVIWRGVEVGFRLSITNLTDFYIVSDDERINITVKLVCETYDDSRHRVIDRYTINRLDIRVDGFTYSAFEFAPGETATTPYYEFFIPEHAIPGKYSLECSYGGSTVVFEDVFTLD